MYLYLYIAKPSSTAKAGAPGPWCTSRESNSSRNALPPGFHISPTSSPVPGYGHFPTVGFGWCLKIGDPQEMDGLWVYDDFGPHFKKLLGIPRNEHSLTGKTYQMLKKPVGLVYWQNVLPVNLRLNRSRETNFLGLTTNKKAPQSDEKTSMDSIFRTNHGNQPIIH